MVDLAIGAAIASLRAAGDMAGGFLKLRDIAQVQGKVIELQSVILAAQQGALASQGEQLALLDEKRGLEQKIADLEAWKREKDRYHLEEIVVGGFAYALNADAQPPEPAHKICARCYEDGRKSIVGPRYEDAGRRRFLCCPRCDAEIQVSGIGAHALPEPPPRPLKADYDPFGPDAH